MASEGLAALNTRVIPSKLMKRGSKYPLKHQEGGEGSPSKDSKKGSPDGLEKKTKKKTTWPERTVTTAAKI